MLIKQRKRRMEKMNSVLTLQTAFLNHWTDKAQKRCYRIVVAYYIMIVLSQQLPFLRSLRESVVLSWVLPLLTILILGFYYCIVPKCGIAGFRRNQSGYIGWAFLFSGLFIASRLILGMILSSLGKSPYDHSLIGIAGNIGSVIPFYMLQELVRVCGLNGCRKKNRWKMFWFLFFLMTLAQIQYSDIFKLEGAEGILKYCFQTLIPLILQQAICNLLAWFGGYPAVMTYLMLPKIFEFLFPVLPNLKWFAEGVLVISINAACLFLLISAVDKLNRRRESKKKESLVQTAVVYVVCILMIWFVAGVFPIYPSVVLTGSMEPEIKPGDIVLIRKCTTQKEVMSAKVGDVINFDRDDINITHRVIEIVEDENGGQCYRTKGDNNPTEDTTLVELSDMNGYVIGTIPKIGLPVLWLKSEEAERTGKEINGQ